MTSAIPPELPRIPTRHRAAACAGVGRAARCLARPAHAHRRGRLSVPPRQRAIRGRSFNTSALLLRRQFIPIPIYGSDVAMFLGIIVLWQMRREPRPLPDALVAQRVQAWVGIVLSLLGGGDHLRRRRVAGPASLP